ncbi:NAD-dependent glutamate dehydrogenase [Atractiella rhizophila]|nr:NAD-dependent glutamate dehydrogenase [Atractiella rhizophila]
MRSEFFLSLFYMMTTNPLVSRLASPTGRAYSPNPAQHLSIPGTPSPSSEGHVPYPSDGYKDNISFAGKKAQAAQVEDLVQNQGFIPTQLVHNEVAWFYNNLGIGDTYFKMESVETIAQHVTSLWGAKVIAFAKHQDELQLDLQKESETSSFFIHTSTPGISDVEGPRYERMMDQKYLDNSNATISWRLESYRSLGNVSSSLAQNLRCYFLSRTEWVDNPGGANERDIKKVADRNFLEKASQKTIEIYQGIMEKAMDRTGPVTDFYEVERTGERRLVIAYKQGSTKWFFSGLSDLYHFYGAYSTRKYVEQFANGITIISIYLMPLRGPPLESTIHQIMREASLIYCLPRNPLFTPATGLAVNEAAYGYVAWIFAQHFLNRLGSSYLALKEWLREDVPEQAQVLSAIRNRFREETYTRQSILEVLHTYPDMIRLLYVNFAVTHHTASASPQLIPTLSYQRLKTVDYLTAEELSTRIQRLTTNKHHIAVLQSFLVFNSAVLKTNFYTPTKVALSFRLDCSFLPTEEYPITPFGLFFVVGSDFRGFHLRFKDVARGGIRIVRSRNTETYSINQRNLFDENYSLASTQALKNKDIPEGGSKGTILPDLDATPRLCFEKYVDSILDLLLKGNSPGIKEAIVDLYNKEEILFFGPDEGTADFMDWAATHARDRGASWWKSFTTGKTAETLGGVPHDLFGCTSLSIRQYTTGIYREMGLKEEDITKVQTGGPDGDLGSNEILLSKDKTIAIIDGSGVAHDPNGLNRAELERLAKARQMVQNFDKSKLGPGGYLVLVDDVDVTLPSGELVPDGTVFRNLAHFRYKADMFVPCGGRPEAVSITNVNQLWDAEGQLKFKFIVEGANLFITQAARLELEKRGVILFKDASANKGGVTSSSLEVLVGLALNDEEYIEMMTALDGAGFSEFYIGYVRAIQETITRNAAAEFDCIWKASKNGQKPRANLTDEIGRTLIDLQSALEDSDLFDDEVVKKNVLKRALPKLLINEIGLDVLMKRLPLVYQRSLFSSYVASRYIYEYGPSASQINFFHFLKKFSREE